MHVGYMWCNVFFMRFSSVQSLSHLWLFATPWIAARQASLSIANSWSSLRFTSIESVMSSSHLILGHPLLFLSPIPPSIKVWESTPRQFDEKSGVLQEKKGFWGSQSGDWGLEFSRRRKGQTFFCLHSSVIVNYTTQLKLCARDYTTTMYPAWGQFLHPENLLANLVILKCKLWEWV